MVGGGEVLRSAMCRTVEGSLQAQMQRGVMTYRGNSRAAAGWRLPAGGLWARASDREWCCCKATVQVKGRHWTWRALDGAAAGRSRCSSDQIRYCTNLCRPISGFGRPAPGLGELASPRRLATAPGAAGRAHADGCACIPRRNDGQRANGRSNCGLKKGYMKLEKKLTRHRLL